MTLCIQICFKCKHDDTIKCENYVKLKVINDETMQKCKHDEMWTLCEHVINVSICNVNMMTLCIQICFKRKHDDTIKCENYVNM